MERCLTPGDPLHVAGAEYLLGAASIEQARVTFRFIRAELEPKGGYRFLDSSTRIGITHVGSNTKLRILSSNAKTAHGIVGCPLMVMDEPGSYETIGGELMNDAITTALGKPDSPLKVIYIGTLAPASSGWWHDLVKAGSTGATYVKCLQGNIETWDTWATIRRANPLTSISADFRRRLLLERDAARADSRLKAQFLSYRLNVPSGDESQMLLTVDDWDRVTAREAPAREGRPLIGVDLGAGRAWSAAVAMYQNGRVEALALAPGIPSLEEQERRDRVPVGTYQTLESVGLLHLAEGLRVQRPGQLVDLIADTWGTVAAVVADRFRD